jgi:polyphosphate kinase
MTDVPPDAQPNLSRFLNRELSLLEFQARVLEEAQDETKPLLERLKFLSIFGSNMDEFFMVRVSGIRKQVDARINDLSPDGLTPREQLAAIRKRSLELFKSAQHCYLHELLPQLSQAGIHILDYKKLNESQRAKADEYFCNIVYPILTPLALDPGHPFPHISTLSLNLAIVIRDKKGRPAQGPGYAPAAPAHQAFLRWRAQRWDSCPSSLLRLAGSSHHGQSGHVVPRNGSGGSPSLPHHPRRGY